MSFSSADINPVIYTPDALPMFADMKYGESLHQKEKRSKKMKPMEPVSGVGKGGRLGGSLTQGFVQTLFPDKIDPREDVSGVTHAGPKLMISQEKRCYVMPTRRTRRSRTVWVVPL